jgi:hypothetical protein
MTFEEQQAPASPLLPDWPSVPEKLGKVTLFTVVCDLADWILVLAPIIFIGS